jgi:hypothetical protein
VVTVPNGTSARGLEDFTDSRFRSSCSAMSALGQLATKIDASS